MPRKWFCILTEIVGFFGEEGEMIEAISDDTQGLLFIVIIFVINMYL